MRYKTIFYNKSNCIDRTDLMSLSLNISVNRKCR